MIHVAAIQFYRHVHLCTGQGGAIRCRQRASLRGAVTKTGQSCAQHRRLQLVEAAVYSCVDVVIAIGLSAVSEAANPSGQRVIIRNHRASIAKRAEILRWIETERAGGAERADRASRARAEVRLAAILDEREALVRRQRRERRHVRRLTVQVNGQDGCGPARDGGLGRRRGQGHARVIDVGKDRTRADHQDRERGVGRGERCRDHLVAGADSERAEGERDRIGAVSHAHRSRCARGASELALEGLDFGSQHEPSTRHHAIDRRAYFVRIVREPEIDKRNVEAAHAAEGGAAGGAPTYSPKCDR